MTIEREILTPLRALARHAGIGWSYRDAWGQRRFAAPETLVAVLRALGYGIERPAEARSVLGEARAASGRQPVPPCVVAWGAGGGAFGMRVPAREAGGPFRATVAAESGGPSRPVALSVHRTGLDGGDRVRVACRLDGTTPAGVYRLAIETGAATHETTLLAAPDASVPPDERRLGLFAPLYALRSGRSWGTGDLADLATLARWAATHGVRFVGTLPLLACFLDEPFDPSPYAPVSRRFWNELYADVTRAPQLELAPAARALLASDELQREITGVRALPLVDYRSSMRLKRRALDALAHAAFEHAAPRRAIEAALAGDPELDRYARFRAAAEGGGVAWPAWPEPWRSGAIDRAAIDESAWRRHVYAQWLMRRQLADLDDTLAAHGSGLYLDLPVGVHPGGYDVWRAPEQFVTGLTVGAPPDRMFPNGQNWGFPPPDPVAGRRDGHHAFRAVVRHHVRHARLLRVDHVMGLHRLFCIPDGADAGDGVYVRYPAEELYAALCLEADAAGARLVGEDLGTVPRTTTRMLERRRIFRMDVAQFAAAPNEDRLLTAPPAGYLATLNTHDLATFGGFERGRDLELLRGAGVIDDGFLHEAREERARWWRALRHHLHAAGRIGTADAPTERVRDAVMEIYAGGAAELFLVNLEDLWLELEPQNLPGVTDGFAPWRRKAARTIEEIVRDPQLANRLDRLAALRC